MTTKTRKVSFGIGAVLMTAGFLACASEKPPTAPAPQPTLAAPPPVSAVPTSPTPPEVPAPMAQPSAPAPETAPSPSNSNASGNSGSDAKDVMKMMEAPTTQPSQPPSTMPDGGY